MLIIVLSVGVAIAAFTAFIVMCLGIRSEDRAALHRSVWIMHRYAGLKFAHALVCFLFGFLIAATGAAPAIRNVMASLIGVLSGRR